VRLKRGPLGCERLVRLSSPPGRGGGERQSGPGFADTHCRPRARPHAFSDAHDRVVLSSQDADDAGRFRPSTVYARCLWFQGMEERSCDFSEPDCDLPLARLPLLQARKTNTRVVLSPFEASTRALPLSRQNYSRSHQPLPIDADDMYLHSVAASTRVHGCPCPDRETLRFTARCLASISPAALPKGVLAHSAVHQRRSLTLLSPQEKPRKPCGASESLLPPSSAAIALVKGRHISEPKRLELCVPVILPGRRPIEAPTARPGASIAFG